MTLIYGLTDPQTKEIRYIGKTATSLSERVSKHYYECRREKHHRARWIRSLLNRGLQPESIILEEVPEEDWQWYEKWWIVYGKTQGWGLTNGTIGHIKAGRTWGWLI